jgi:hypothetical protein
VAGLEHIDTSLPGRFYAGIPAAQRKTRKNFGMHGSRTFAPIVVIVSEPTVGARNRSTRYTYIFLGTAGSTVLIEKTPYNTVVRGLGIVIGDVRSGWVREMKIN